MVQGWSRQLAIVLAAVALTCAACGTELGASVERSADAAPAAQASTTGGDPPTSEELSTTQPPTTTTAPTTTTTTTTTTPPIPRVVVDTGYSPFAVTGPVTLHHPVAPTERVGFHQAGHDGAQQLDAATSATRPFVLETRDRGTGDRTAADIVVQPGAEVRAPVTGTVLRGGGYTLYCDHHDEFVVIEPDARPGWEVKVLHFEGLQVGRGQRVEAGVTVLATTARTLPFESQVDEFTAEPSWPHLHVEVVDPSIPDRPSPGGGGGCG